MSREKEFPPLQRMEGIAVQLRDKYLQILHFNPTFGSAAGSKEWGKRAGFRVVCQGVHNGEERVGRDACQVSFL